MKRVAFRICFLTSIMVLLPVAAIAQEGRIRFGNLRIVPGITGEVMYDDNIFLGNGTNEGEELKESDTIFSLKPSLLLDYNIQGRGSVSLGYQGILAYYSDRDENDWQNQKLQCHCNPR